MGSNRRSRRRVEPTDEWEQIELLCGVARAERLRAHPSPGAVRRPAAGALDGDRRRLRADPPAQGRPLRRRRHGEPLRLRARARKRLPPAIRRLVVDLKAEYPRFNLNEIANAVYVRFGRRPDHKTVRAGPRGGARPLEVRAPLPALPRDPRAQGRPGGRGGAARRRLEREGHLRLPAGRLPTVYRILRRWAEEGLAGLEDRPHGRPPGVRKVTSRAMEAIRRFQGNPTSASSASTRP